MDNSILKSRYEVKPSWKVAFISAVFAGLLIHLYKFTNNLPNHDSLYNYYGDQNMISSGRWFLTVACGFSSYFDLPWVIGVISLVFIGFTAAVIVDIFRITNPCMIVLTSFLLISFPALTETMMFEFTADGYMLAMFLAALSVFVFRMEHADSWARVIVSAICLCLSCAIYQAYLSFAMAVAICYFMLELLDNRISTKVYAKWIAKVAIIYVLALAAYYIIWELMLRIQGTSAGNYLGMDQLGQINILTFFMAIKQSVFSFGMFLLGNNILEHGLSLYSLINILILLIGAVGTAYAVIDSGLFQSKGKMLLFVICVLILPFSCSIWLFASPGVSYTPRMYQSIAVLYIFIGTLFLRWTKAKMRGVMAVLLIVFVFNNAIIANICYSFMERSYSKTYATAIEMNTRIHLADDGNAKNVVFVGIRQYWDEEEILSPGGAASLGPLRDSVKYSYITGGHLIIPFLTQYTDFSLPYYIETGMKLPDYEPVGNSPTSGGWSLQFPTLNEDEVSELACTDEVQEMGMWPASDSVQQIGETIVVKLSDIHS